MKLDLSLFKEQYNVDDYFVSVFESLIEKLITFEYISNAKAYSLIDNFEKNVKEIRIGKNNSYDYKSGYYDANKKELYIKDVKNIPAMYLRLLYALTSRQTDTNAYTVGFSKTVLRKDSYKLSYENYGINRAIMSNLVYKLCDMLPYGISLVPTNKTYSNDFLGFKIESANDIYYVEGKLLAELCFVLDLDEEILYSALFSKSPINKLYNILDQKGFSDKDKFLKLLDKISKNYNTYNKLAFLSKKLNDNYIEYKKNVLNSDTKKIAKEKEIIESQILSVLNSLDKKYGEITEDEIEFNISLSETLEKLEQSLIKDITKYQDVLSDNIITINSHLPYTKFASKLKQFNDILIVPNKKISKAIQDTILFKLMPEDEVTGINLVQKIKYAIIENILSDKDFVNISNTFSFYNITNFENSDKGSTLILLKSDKRISKVVEITGLNKNLKSSFKFNLDYIPLDNLHYIMNSNYSDIYIGDIEELYSSLLKNFEELKGTSIENLYVFKYENKNYIVAFKNSNIYVLSFNKNNKDYVFNMLNLSEEYKVFGKSNASFKPTFKSNLPMISNKKVK